MSRFTSAEANRPVWPLLTPAGHTVLSSQILPYVKLRQKICRSRVVQRSRSNPVARVESRAIGMGGEVQLVFELWNPQQPSQLLDWHLSQVRRQADGLLIHDFVYHSPKAGDKELEKFRKDVDQSRLGWEQEVSSAKWPAPPACSHQSRTGSAPSETIRWYIHSPHVFVEKLLIEAPFSLNHLPQPPEHAWLYVRPASDIASSDISVFWMQSAHIAR